MGAGNVGSTMTMLDIWTTLLHSFDILVNIYFNTYLIYFKNRYHRGGYDGGNCGVFYYLFDTIVDAVPVDTHKLTLAHHRVSSSSVVRASD